MPPTVHATVVAIGDSGVLIEGRSGAGKSDLALRLIDRGATLVSDDRTCLSLEGNRLLAAPASTLAGLLEVRGLGIVPFPYRSGVPVDLVVRLDEAPERLPRPRTRMLLDVPVRLLALDPRPASAPLLVELALRHAAEVAP